MDSSNSRQAPRQMDPWQPADIESFPPFLLRTRAANACLCVVYRQVRLDAWAQAGNQWNDVTCPILTLAGLIDPLCVAQNSNAVCLVACGLAWPGTGAGTGCIPPHLAEYVRSTYTHEFAATDNVPVDTTRASRLASRNSHMLLGNT